MPYLFILIASLFSSFTVGDTHGECLCEITVYFCSVRLQTGLSLFFSLCNFKFNLDSSKSSFIAFPGFKYVTCGSVVKLLNPLHNVRLHSHEIKYGSGSGQQVIGVSVATVHSVCVSWFRNL